MWNIAAGLVANALGKGVGNIIEHLLPPPPEARRNALDTLKKERDEILRSEETKRNHTRLEYLMGRIGVLEKKSVNS